ncbi:unnamed protein product [Trypanosoma congolense IL3000]|uniref:WGS project CAEQ00000000 data, annotated contig 1022 n=1 Tax=Trypanosoma congolense (strain IL3000) TaxID=1068625 RepID=F9W394_TRYCI|nr:unnamed protein product [Trypanosoma congolense IL3000]
MAPSCARKRKPIDWNAGGTAGSIESRTTSRVQPVKATTEENSEHSQASHVAARQGDTIIFPLCNVASAHCQAGVVYRMKVHGIDGERVLVLTNVGRNASHECNGDYDVFLPHVAPLPERGCWPFSPAVSHASPNSSPMYTASKRNGEEEEGENADSVKLKRLWCCKKHSSYGRLKRHVLAKHPYKRDSQKRAVSITGLRILVRVKLTKMRKQ